MTLKLSLAFALTVSAFVNIAHPQPKLDHYGDPLPTGAIARLGTTRFRHVQRIIDATYSADGKRIIAVAENGAVRVFDADSGRVLNSFHVNNGIWPGAVAQSAKQGLAAMIGTGTDPTTHQRRCQLLVVDTDSGKPRLEVEVDDRRDPLGRFRRRFVSLAWSPQGKTLAGGSSDGIVYIWEAATGKLLRQETLTHTDVYDLEYSPDGRTIAATANAGLLLWNWKAKQPPTLIPRNQIRVAPDVAYSRDGKLLAAIPLFDEGLFLVDAQTHQTHRVLLPPDKRYAFGPEVVFTPDGKFVAASDIYGHRILVWRLPGGEFAQSIHAPLVRPGKLIVSPDSRRIATFDNTVIRQWELTDSREIRPFSDAHLDEVSHISFGGHPQTIVTGGRDGAVRLWNVETQMQKLRILHGRRRTSRPNVLGLAFSPDGRWIASAANDNTTRLWNALTGKEVYRLPGHGQTGGDCPVAFSTDSRRFATWGIDWRLRLWEVDTGKALAEHRLQVGDRARVSFEERLERDQYNELDDESPPYPTGFSHDAARFFGQHNGVVHQFDTATGKQLHQFAWQRPLRLAASSSGRTVLLGVRAEDVELRLPGEDVRRIRQNAHTLSLAAAETGRSLWTTEELSGRPGPLAISPNDQLMAHAPHKSPPEIHIYNSMGDKQQTIDGFGSVVNSLAFSADGTLLAAGLSDTTVLVWKVAP